MGILLTRIEVIRAITAKYSGLDPEFDIDFDAITETNKAQLKKDFELWLKPNCHYTEAMPFQTVTIPTKLYQALLKEIE